MLYRDNSEIKRMVFTAPSRPYPVFPSKSPAKPAFDHDHAAPTFCQTNKLLNAPFQLKFTENPLFFISTIRLNILEILG
jgi:hypothetical protein